jgi:hypothetical protein
MTKTGKPAASRTPSRRSSPLSGRVRRLYGHRDKGRALDRIVGAYATRAENRRTRSQSSGMAEPQQSLFGGTYVRQKC